MSGLPPSPAMPRWPERVYAAVAIFTVLLAFVGLSASGLWTDELFTLHVINHRDGLGEVWRRALTDTQPPLYYLLLYGWSGLAGLSETALRLPSAVLATLALALFAGAARRIASGAAVAFACAIAATSPFWFEQSQNARSYALDMALSAALLLIAVTLRERIQWQPTRPLTGGLIALLAVGLLASFCHAYLLLALGCLLLWLLPALPRWRTRLAVALGGLLILALNLAYIHRLLASTQQDLQHLWFRNDGSFFLDQLSAALHATLPAPTIWVVAGLLIAWLARRLLHAEHARASGDQRLLAGWSSGLAACVIVGLIVGGIVVSRLLAPSFSDRNLLTCAPFAWLLLAGLYDRAGVRGSQLAAVLVSLALLTQLLPQRGRGLDRNEAWRASARYVMQLPGCAGQTLPVLLPFKFGPASAPFRQLAEQDFFGHYLPDTPLRAYLPAELAGRHPSPELDALWRSRVASADNGGCAALLWAVHDVDRHDAIALARDLARQPVFAGHRVLLQEFVSADRHRLGWRLRPSGFVFLLIPTAANGASSQPPGSESSAEGAGDRWVIHHLDTVHGNDGPAYRVDLDMLQRWPRQGAPSERFLADQRLQCDPPPALARQDLWPDPRYPGCSPRLAAPAANER